MCRGDHPLKRIAILTNAQDGGQSIADLRHLGGRGHAEFANETLFGGSLELIHNRHGRTSAAGDSNEQGELGLLMRAGKRHHDNGATETIERLPGNDGGGAGLLDL